jgi:hypothetical protein
LSSAEEEITSNIFEKALRNWDSKYLEIINDSDSRANIAKELFGEAEGDILEFNRLTGSDNEKVRKIWAKYQEVQGTNY